MSAPAQASAPVGVFDSGVGGLTVLSDIHALLPGENLLYVADSGHAPYGDKSVAFITERALAVTRFLISQGAKAIVVACNTATGAAVARLRAEFSLPIVAMEPAIKPAVANSKSRVVGVLATTRTLESENLARLQERFGAGSEILLQACPGLVERVEACDFGADTRALVQHYVKPLVARGADTLVLGCTHYPFLLPLIEAAAGPGIAVINPGPAVARELRRRLEVAGLLNPADGSGAVRYWATGDTARVEAAIAKLQGQAVRVEALAGD